MKVKKDKNDNILQKKHPKKKPKQKNKAKKTKQTNNKM